MIQINSAIKLNEIRTGWTGKVGFVPTMGALHSGHKELILKSVGECDFTVVSIFVNPTQFNDKQDLDHYPRPLDLDLQMLEDLSVDAVFLPEANEVYRDEFRFQLHESSVSSILCGRARPGHFTGVLTVVLKLFNMVRPTDVFFGEKDFQQLRLIDEMIKALFLPTRLHSVPTVREIDGLALSSRNMRLTSAQREQAPKLFYILKNSSSASEAAERLDAEGFKVDYVEEHWGRRLAAVFLGDVRLIDNVEI